MASSPRAGEASLFSLFPLHLLSAGQRSSSGSFLIWNETCRRWSPVSSTSPLWVKTERHFPSPRLSHKSYLPCLPREKGREIEPQLAAGGRQTKLILRERAWRGKDGLVWCLGVGTSGLPLGSGRPTQVLLGTLAQPPGAWAPGRRLSSVVKWEAAGWPSVSTFLPDGEVTVSILSWAGLQVWLTSFLTPSSAQSVKAQGWGQVTLRSFFAKYH